MRKMLLAVTILFAASLFGALTLAYAQQEASPSPAGEVEAVGASPLAESENTGIVFSPLNQEVMPSAYITVAIRIENADKLVGVDMTMSYDPEVVIVVDAQEATSGTQILPGSFLQPSFEAENSADNAAGIIKYAATHTGIPPVSGEGVLAVVTFQGVGFGTTDLRFESVTMYGQVNGTVGPIKVTKGPAGSITVIQPAPISKVYMPAILKNRQ